MSMNLSQEIDPRLCEICKGLRLQRSDFEDSCTDTDGRSGEVILQDTLENLMDRQSRCSLCHLIWLAIRRNEYTNPELFARAPPEILWETVWMENNLEYSPVSDEAVKLYGSALHPRLIDISGSHSDYCIQLIDDHNTNGFLRGRMIPETIDVTMLKGWLARCEHEHGSNCSPAILEISTDVQKLPVPLLVIDVVQECLVGLPPAAEYVTLSYVWGPSNWPRASSTNIDDLRLTGSLQGKVLPRTISDAMEVVALLGLRYLWVDSVCIVQDDPMRQSMIRSMDTVYGSACLCIVAASGSDAGEGLSGWSQSDTRLGIIPTEYIKPDLRLGILPHFDRELMNSPHAQRAWTFQEGVLSNRCLVFLNSLVFFSCRSATWREDVHAEISGSIESMEGANTLGRTLGENYLGRFRQLLDAYLLRSLTFPSDALDAFAGIQKAITKSMDYTRFWYGLPASAFDWAILWGGIDGAKLKRRSQFPSWSWAGWDGGVLMPLDHYNELDHIWLNSRTWIDWYIVDGDAKCVLVWHPERDGTIKSMTYETALDTEAVQTNSPATKTDQEIYDEHGGQGDGSSQPSEDEDENDDTSEACPQYGWPKEGNPYGRTHHTTIPPLPFPDDSTNDFQPKSPLKPSTLYFQTITTCFTLGSPNSLIQSTNNSARSTYSPYYPLLDKENRPCGLLWDIGTIPSSVIPPRHEKVEILLLSAAAPGTKTYFDALKLTLESPYGEPDQENDDDGEDLLGDWHSYNMFNVMFIVPFSSVDNGILGGVNSVSKKGKEDADHVVYERRAAGLLHKHALKHALDPGPRWRGVYLC